MQMNSLKYCRVDVSTAIFLKFFIANSKILITFVHY